MKYARIKAVISGGYTKVGLPRMPSFTRLTLPKAQIAKAHPKAQGQASHAALPVSYLRHALTVTGHLDTDGELHVYGHVLGRIDADCLVVGRFGHVEGDIVARDVRIEGRLNGRVFAHNVTLESSADITGRIFHHTVTVESGARIDGRMPWRPVSYFESLDQLPETRQ
ncbi:MAG TPA: polymer-forming cytoskeletal protein [Rhizomicrobium sp.]|nr:polymer-forming cytoskeletal protein [Rhizomicrobium sp.]